MENICECKLIEDDANKWWESGPVRNLLIQNNTFLNCGIDIALQTVKPDGTVHENIRIIGNKFVGQAKTNPTESRGVIDCPFITAKGVKGLNICRQGTIDKGIIKETI